MLPAHKLPRPPRLRAALPDRLHVDLTPAPAAGDKARPFLKWVGGKTQLLPEILARFPERFGRYFEPFLGGGAVFFALAPERAVLTDVNARLIATYQAIRDELPAVVAALHQHRAERDHYYRVRALDPDTLRAPQAAARMLFLNRTCFNGLYRVNRRGEFNVPFGDYRNPTLCDESNLRAVALRLSGADLRVASVFDVAQEARRGDLVYLDPPYDPVSPTASFTAYTAAGFGRAEQERLATLFRALARRGVHVVLSNSDTPFIRELYRDFCVEQVFARRAINRRAEGRGPVPELLITVG